MRVLTDSRQFDDVDLAVLPNRTITSLGLLEFHHFEAVNMTTAVESGFLALGDLDCAVSRPNILHGVSEPYHTPSVIRTNASALAEAGLASYFDIVSFSWKPLGPAPPFVGIIMAVYRIDDGIPTYVDNMATIWSDDEDTSDGFLPPSTETPAEWWPGWGSKTNWIEIESWADHGESWQFCLDNLVLRFYKEDREDSE